MRRNLFAMWVCGAFPVASPALAQPAAETGTRFGGLGDWGFILIVAAMGLAIWYFSRKRRGV
jgi:hypothetical protein